MTTTGWDVPRGASVFDGFGRSSGPRALALNGCDVLDGMLTTGFKLEWMAALAGVVPLVTIGQDQVLGTIGNAGVNPRAAWPQKALGALYMAGQRNSWALHGSVLRGRSGAVPIDLRRLGSRMLAPGVPAAGLQLAPVSGISPSMGVLPVAAWVVIGVVSCFATAAAAWYAVRTHETEVQVDAERAKQNHVIGSLADIASAQLSTTGAVDPGLVQAIAGLGAAKTSPSDYTWAYVAAGGVVLLGAGAAGSYYLTRRSRR